MKEFFEKVLNQIILNSKEWETFLKFMAHSPYELENQILIYAQNPKISYPLYTKLEWKELKRELKPDSKGIIIIKDNTIEIVYTSSDTMDANNTVTEKIEFEIKENSFLIFEWNENFLKQNKYKKLLEIDNSLIDMGIFDNIIRNSVNFMKEVQLNLDTTEWKNRFGDIICFNNQDNILLLLVIIQDIMTKLVIKKFKIERKNYGTEERSIRKVWQNGNELSETTKLFQISEINRGKKLNSSISRSQSRSGRIVSEASRGAKNQTTSRNSRLPEKLFSGTGEENICRKRSSSEGSICRKIERTLLADKQVEAKRKPLIPIEIKNRVLYHGLGTQRSKQEITSFFNTHPNKEQRIQFLKSFYYFYKEYFNLLDISLKEIQANPQQGIKIVWEEEINFLSWSEIEEGIAYLIKQKRYLEPYYIIEETNEREINKKKEQITAKKKEEIIEEKKKCKYFLQICYNDKKWFEEHIYNRKQLEYSIIELKEKAMRFWENIKKRDKNFTKEKYFIEQKQLKEYYNQFVIKRGAIRMLLQKEEDLFLYSLEYQNIKGEIRETNFFTHFFTYSPEQLIFNPHKKKKKKTRCVCLKDLEKQDVFQFGKESLEIKNITENTIKKDDETGYWVISSLLKHPEERIILLEAALNTSSYNFFDSKTTEIQEKFKDWIKKHPNKQKYYIEKIKKEEQKTKVNSITIITNILDILFYLYKIECREIKKIVLVLPKVIASYVKETYVSFYPSIRYYQFINSSLYQKEYNGENLIFLSEEQYHFIPLKSKQKEIEEISNKIILLNRCMYMEEHIYTKNEKRIRNLQRKIIKLTKEKKAKEKMQENIFTLEEFYYDIILYYKERK